MPEYEAFDPRAWEGDSLNGVVATREERHTYDVRMLQSVNTADWHWHPHVMLRLIRFLNEFEGQGDPQMLVRNLQQAFIMDDPGMMVIAFWMDGELIGHILCDRSILYYKPIITVHQYHLDHGIPPGIRHEAVQIIKDWARSTGPNNDREPADLIQWLVRDRRLVPLYQRFFGAKAHTLLMRMSAGD